MANNTGEVIGVVAEKDGKEIRICARRAVILTTGGYEFDSKMLQTTAQKGWGEHRGVSGFRQNSREYGCEGGALDLILMLIG